MSSKKETSFSAVVWENGRLAYGSDTISQNLYNVLFLGTTLGALLLTAFCASLSQGWRLEGWSSLLIVVPLLLGSFGGVFVAATGIRDENAPQVLFGLGIMAASLGLLTGPVVAQYTEASVMKVVAITTLLVAMLAIIGAIIPRSLESWGGILFGGLLLLILGNFGLSFLALFGVNIEGALGLRDWIGLVLFGGYVLYDVNRAQRLTKTSANAVYAAVGFYLDIMNIFMILLRMLGNKK